MTSVVVADGGGNMVEYVTVMEETEQEYPAVVVEEVPSAQLEQCYAAQVLVYDDGTYLMQDVGDEQEVVTEVVETGEREGGAGLDSDIFFVAVRGFG
uniref:Transcription factor Elf N-terminal domain-containing protein n=1 Tax=Oncorhynchus kisutch TaxID=8019 RepID=A0A8C7MFH0_ONCKI